MTITNKLQAVILRDTGIAIDIPESVNRGCWGKWEGCFRWTANEIGGQQRRFACEDSMTACIRFGVYRDPRPAIYQRQEWMFDVSGEQPPSRR